jgi:hypothetical protein
MDADIKAGIKSTRACNSFELKRRLPERNGYFL